VCAAFNELSQLDQLQLIKKSFTQVWLVRIARMFNCQTQTLIFADGSYISRDQLDAIFMVDI
jgi:hypothetical protein